MKKLLSILLVGIMCVSISACSSGTDNSKTEEVSTEESKNNIIVTNASMEGYDYGVEEFYMKDTEASDFCNFSVKVRNYTEEKTDMIGIIFQALDTNGDIICDGETQAKRVFPEQGAQTDVTTISAPYSEIGSINIIGYSVYEAEEGTDYSFSWIETVEYDELININVSDIQIVE